LKIKERESHIQDLKIISDNYEKEIASNETMVLSIKQLENLGFDASDIKNLGITLSEISRKYGLNKNEIKTRFFRCMSYYFNDLLPLQQDIWKKRNEVSILDSEISSRRKVIEESQPIVFSILQNLVNAGLNEYNILMALNIFKTDLCNKMPYGGDRTYFESLSKDLDKYPTVRDTLQGLNNKILIKKSHIDKLVVAKSKLEIFLFSLLVTIYVYSIVLNAAKIQTQKNLKILLNLNFNSYLLPLLFVCKVIKKHKKSIRSKFIRNRTEEQQTKRKKR
jgi:hypothetical protein